MPGACLILAAVLLAANLSVNEYWAPNWYQLLQQRRTSSWLNIVRFRYRNRSKHGTRSAVVQLVKTARSESVYHDTMGCLSVVVL